MCRLWQAARLDLAKGRDRMLCPQEWYPSHGAAASLPISWLAMQAVRAGGVMTCLSTGPRFSRHAGSRAATWWAPDLAVLLFQLERAFVCQLLTDSQGYLPRAGSELGKIIFHINTALQVHQAHYLTRQILLSFGPCIVPWRKGSGTNTERYMTGSRSHEC